MLPLSTLIRISNLKLRTYIGFNPEEQQKKQDITVNVQVRYPFNSDLKNDDIEGALNYKTITKNIINHVESNRFLLLEKLTSDILEICCRAENVEYVCVQVDKPHALRFADSVSVTLEYDQKETLAYHQLEKAS